MAQRTCLPGHATFAEPRPVGNVSILAFPWLVFVCLTACLEAQQRSLYEMSPLELAQVEVSAGTLVSTEMRYSPNSITIITRDMIKASGARNLLELLSTFVPSFQTLRHPALPDRIGMRGMISDLNTKMILLVNGKVMNSQPLLGISSEVDLSLLDDIDCIEVVSGSGSATYGSGALNGIISITTRNGDSFKGGEVSGSAGAEEVYGNAEVQWGGTVPWNGRLYAYYGLDHYVGASVSDSPVFFGTAFDVKKPPYAVHPDTAVELPFVKDRGADRDVRQKVFLDFRKENLDLWFRYTEGGTSGLRAGRLLLINQGMPLSPEDYRAPYDQLTVSANYRLSCGENWHIENQVSYDQMHAEWYLAIPSRYRTGEKKLSARSIAKWTPGEKHALAFGAEFLHGSYHGEYFAGGAPAAFDWDTTSYAFLAEHAWHFLPAWHSIVSARIDKRTQSDFVLSPRLAMIFEPVPSTNIAFAWSRSNRFADEYYYQYSRSLGQAVEPERENLETVELRVTQMLGRSLRIQALGYWSKQDVLAWDPAQRVEKMQGTLRYHGIELLGTLTTEKVQVNFSHVYTKLESMRLLRPNTQTLLTSQPYGYGDDFHMVPRHLTKLSINYRITGSLSVFASLQHAWRYEGARDYAWYNRQVLHMLAFTMVDPGAESGFAGPTTVNFNAVYDISKKWTLSLSAHNLLGWFDNSLNKIRYYSCMDACRAETAALAAKLTWRF